MNPSIQAPLSGAALHAFLDQAESALEQQQAAEVAVELRRATMAAMLARQACRAGDVEAVTRLHRLWLQAGLPEQALRVLQDDGAAVVANLPAQDRPDAETELAFCRIEAALELRAGTAAVAQALDAAEQLLRAQPPSDAVDDAWARLAAWSGEADDPARVRRCAEARHDLRMGDPDRDTYRSWDAARLQTQLAASHHAEGRLDEAQRCARAALEALATAGPGQDVDTDDWLHFGEQLLRIAPMLVDEIARHAPARLPADAALPVRRQLGVQLARLQARALHARGLLDQALAKAPEGRFYLSCGEDDSFSALVLDWLVEAERWPEAARLAFESARSEREVSGLHACRIAAAHQERATEDDETRFHWALARAAMGQYEDLRREHGISDRAAHCEQHLARAERLMPGDPAIKVMRGEYMLATGQDPAQTLRWLEACVERPGLAGPYLVEQMVLLRAQVHGGLRKALALPFIDAPAGTWSYNVGVLLGDLHEKLPEDAEWPLDEIRALQTRYYERGLQCFEAFFETGRGHYRDGNTHDYSMLCNNLGIAYRCWHGKPALALPLHAKGIAASPFAEHYDGVMCCHRDAGEREALIEAAERLWHFAAAHGYGRHRPDHYIDDVCIALEKLDRHGEAAIWRQRLQEWWQQLDDDERGEYGDSHLETLVIALCVAAGDQPDDVVPQLEELLPRILAQQDRPVMLGNTALAFKRAGRHPQAIAVYREILARFNSGSEDDAARCRDAQESLDACLKALRGERPWWKFWG